MIGGIRKFAKSKWALVLLFIPLIISFGIFGFQDPFSGITGGGLSRVGDREIHARDLNEELSAEIDAIREQDGRVLTQADAIREGVAQQVLARLVGLAEHHVREQRGAEGAEQGRNVEHCAAP